ncbi:U-box domain-containing protein 52-like isoform X2 [Ananas comosus]|uniref:RING-type E3 ubiquitin transferase n=1 Tax=Ananas comosus TaxID=4615 RepID=A0A6P5FCN6_ANACO|nr:U-box domain-containing protein 52-like isoform X2 [Ananas comosus]
MEIKEVKEGVESSPSSSLIVGLAANGTKNSRFMVRWALDNFMPKGRVLFKLFHVRPKIKMVPTPLGNYIPIDQVRGDVAAAYKKDVEWQTEEMLLLYKKMFNEKKAEAEILIIEADDVAEAISKEVSRYKVSNLVVGASSGNGIIRRLTGGKLSSRIIKCIPSFCTVYIVSDGRLSSVHSPGSTTDSSAVTSGSEESFKDENDSTNASSNSLKVKFDMYINLKAISSLLRAPLQPSQKNQPFSNGDPRRSSCDDTHGSIVPLGSDGDDVVSGSSILQRTIRRNLAFYKGNRNRSGGTDTSNTKHFSPSTNEHCSSASSNGSEAQDSCSASGSDKGSRTSCNSDRVSSADSSQDSSLLENEVDIDFELERLRTEIRHLRGVYKLAEDESVGALKQINELAAQHMEEEVKLRDINFRVEKAEEIAQQEKEKRKAAEIEAEYVRQFADQEASRRKGLEDMASNKASEKEWLKKSLEHAYLKFTWEEIASATASFSDSFKIGVGSNGTVYKGTFRHTVVAVKVLHSNEGARMKQFNQELDILGRIRHPHLLLLLGACPEPGCLVYEYMENGSLDDRLQCQGDTPPIPWFCRFRIAWEVASALLFLHSTRPEPIIHRDLKPANILLDKNFVSKIGDVGLSTLLPHKSSSLSTVYKDTAPVGTFFYMDPEYQRSGLVSTKSDIYGLGMVILQLLTAKSPMGLTYIIENAIGEEGCLRDILDPRAGNWPTEEAKELARLGLSCLELRRKDRPDLGSQILPLLEKLKDTAEKARVSTQIAPTVPPSYFLCPILNRVMDDPCIASDGYTYDRDAIEKWLSKNGNSPMTNVPLPNKELIPNQSLLSAIKCWKSRSS